MLPRILLLRMGLIQTPGSLFYVYNEYLNVGHAPSSWSRLHVALMWCVVTSVIVWLMKSSKACTTC